MVHSIPYEHYFLVDGRRVEPREPEVESVRNELTFKGRVDFEYGERVMSVVATPYSTFRHPFPEFNNGSGTIVWSHTISGHNTDAEADAWKGEDE